MVETGPILRKECILYLELELSVCYGLQKLQSYWDSWIRTSCGRNLHALRPIQIIYIMHIICSVISSWFELSKSDPIPCDKKHAWLRTPHLPFHMCKRVWAWDCTQTEYCMAPQAEKACTCMDVYGIWVLSFSYSPFQPVSSATEKAVTNGKNLATTMSFVQSTKEDSPA